MKKHLPVLAVFTAAFTALGNGGPIETSPVFSAGQAGPLEFVRRDVELLSEELILKPVMNYVKVEVTYVLHNQGEDLETGYGFPIVAATKPSEDWYEDQFDEEGDVLDFTILQDGVELPVSYEQIAAKDSTYSEYGWEVPVSTYLYTTDLSIQAGDTTTVQVSYSVRATYEDFQTTKDFFPSYEDRRFIYDLAPASWWGSGTVGEYTMILNIAELDGLGGTMMDIPPGGDWETELLYVERREDFRLSAAEPVYFAWETQEACLSGYIEQYILSPDRYTITASSQLDGYGVENLSDGDLSTCWCEGEEGITGAWIEIQFDPDVEFAWIGIVPGYAKDEYTYTANARPAEVRAHNMEYSYDFNDQIIDIPEVPWEDIETGMAWHIYKGVFNRGEIYHMDGMRITFEEAYPGADFEDLCISELVVAGWSYN